MDEPLNQLAVDIQDLQAESRALQMVVAFLLVHNVAALELLEQLEPLIADLAAHEALTDRQVAVFRSTLSKMVVNVRRCRDSLPPPQ